AIEQNHDELSRYFDLDFLKNLNEELYDYLAHYFRPGFVGFDQLPAKNENGKPLIYACNHSGMAFPWDAIVMGSGLYKKHNYDFANLFRALAAPALSASTLMNPFLLTNMWKRVGALDASTLNFETMLAYSESNILIYPEGVPGIGKGFNRKYELQSFSTSMIRMAIKHKTDIVGISCVNGEYINPYSYSWKWLDRQVNKLGIPYLPVALQTPMLLLQPWTFYYAWPAKLTYVRGNRYSPSEMVSGRELNEVSQEEVAAVRDQIQEDMQKHLNQNVAQFGKKPFNMKELWQTLKSQWRSLPYWTPIGWPSLFSEYNRRYQRGAKPPKGITRGWLRFWKIIWHNPIIFAYFIPVIGWIPILYKGMRDRRKVDMWHGSKVK
ncbi:MAG: 1-acyl-sn-glycerol-3-phosphate acyltransferase, partial [Bacteroidota bacterium]